MYIKQHNLYYITNSVALHYLQMFFDLDSSNTLSSACVPVYPPRMIWSSSQYNPILSNLKMLIVNIYGDQII